MGVGLEAIGRPLLAAAREADTASEFTDEVARLIRPWIPHDSYLVSGQDPVTGASCLWLADQRYLAELTERLYEIDVPLYWYGPWSAGRAAASAPVRLLDGRRARGSGERTHKLVSLLAEGGRALGSLTLLRVGRQPFTTADVELAGALSEPLAKALRRFIAGGTLRPPRRTVAPGVVTVGADHDVLGITPTARESLRVLRPDDQAVDDRQLVSVLWNTVYLARQGCRRALSRLPTPDGWLAVHAEPYELNGSRAVAVTVEAAQGELLLPVLATWYRASPAELGVVRQVIAGLPSKQVARRLELSVHTVHDHLRSVYRKTGVAGRDELLARLG
ncbi:helix-turn-helix transcriptional regulator [Amycolatopsis australiensis]|uniref:DNA-binding transcriptional regulator, CsgD family n=1 Tax=Amycolatopsis australiensis TaxID=546364 RepID=A0A1K1SQW3_9PSEU|nr:helix-turn-helix transcriptional regulator [Amycolatopsis australiensis]SFW86670.1 DNA-binding transcriptional regulator, CsgD family [Amycolatopsis australiensis]